jgi:arylsulfatase
MRSILLASIVFWVAAADSIAAERPNIVLILADDMGWSDLGCYGSEIRTPHLDRLASEGTRFRQFYNNAICHLTRASLLTGRFPQRSRSGGPLLAESVPTLADLLHEAGYRTVLSGKWHLGRQAPNRPIDRGFDEYYGLLDGCANYFNPVQPDPEFEGGRTRVWGHNAELVKQFPDDFYATEAIADHAIEHIRRFAAEKKPFFAHVCFTAVHSPLHARPRDIGRYQGRYDGGWDALRRERHARQIELGLIDKNTPLPPLEPETPAWKDAQYKPWQASLMEVYAAMIDAMDQNIGRILQTLEATGTADNTIVLFLSDNGGCAEQAGGDDPTNIPGPREHYVSVGAGWACAQNTPLRRYKAWVHEGGIRTPLIVRWPGQIKPDTWTNQVGHIIDVLPTCLEIAGVAQPWQWRDKPLELDGISLTDALHGRSRLRQHPLYWEWSGNRAVRQGDWKLVHDNTVNRWELYDLSRDSNEMHDLATSQPERVERMLADWQAWAKRTGVDQTSPKRIRLKPE